MRVLVIEDDPTLRMVLSAALGILGWATEGVADAADVAAYDVDVILADLTLGTALPADTIARITGAAGGTPVVIHTGTVPTEEFERLLSEQGIADVIEKPASADLIHRRLLAVSRKTRQGHRALGAVEGALACLATAAHEALALSLGPPHGTG